MRILHIASGDFFSTYGGGQVYVKNIVDAMIDMGLDIAVISYVSGHTEIIQEKYKGALLLEIGSVRHLEDTIKKVGPSVIHAHSMKRAVCRIGYKHGIPVIVTAHHGGILCPSGAYMNYKDVICNVKVNHMDCLPCVLRNTRTGLKYWYPFVKHLKQSTYLKIGNFLQNKPFIPFITPIGSSAKYIQSKQHEFSDISQYCKFMVAPCTKIGEAMVTNGLDQSKLRIVPHGIPIPEYHPVYPEIANDKLKLYCVGRICYVKGIHVLLEAFSHIQDLGIELHIIGGAGNKSEHLYMNKLLKKYNFDNRIIWHGKMDPDKIFEVSKDFHVLISPTICMEAYGLNIAEALALGKPVLTTASGGGEMQIMDGVNGWIIAPNDSKALYEKIVYISEHRNILPVMSVQCHAISVKEHCERLLEIYNESYNLN